MTPNDKLPEETYNKVLSDAVAYDKERKMQVAYQDGATAWAGWKLRFDELQAQAKAMADALEKHKEAYDYLAKEAERKYTEAYENDTKPVAATLMFNMLHKSYIEASRRTSEALQQFKDWKEVKDGIH